MRQTMRASIPAIRGTVQPLTIVLLGERHNTLGGIRAEWWDARGSCLITQEAVVTRLHEAFLPPPHRGLRLAGPAHNLIGADTVCAQQNDLGPPDMLMRCVAIPRDRGQTVAINRLESNGNSGRMRQTCMQRARRESLPGFKC